MHKQIWCGEWSTAGKAFNPTSGHRIAKRAGRVGKNTGNTTTV